MRGVVGSSQVEELAAVHGQVRVVVSLPVICPQQNPQEQAPPRMDNAHICVVVVILRQLNLTRSLLKLFTVTAQC